MVMGSRLPSTNGSSYGLENASLLEGRDENESLMGGFSFKIVPVPSPSDPRSSDCEDDPAEGTALNQVAQSFSRFGQREGLSHDRFDRTGLK
jgi:hypothetical protein